VIIDDLDVIRLAVAPTEYNSPLIVDPNRMKVLEVFF
jgi:hypothetical protein